MNSKEIILKKYNIIEESENFKSFFYKIEENNIIKLIKVLKNNNHFYYEGLNKIKDLKHKNFTNIEQVYFDGKINYIKMEFFQNSISLRRFLKKYNKNIELNHLIKIFQQIADAIDFLHENNLAHFDLAYSNILLNDDYLVKITDFELIKVTSLQKQSFNLVDILMFAEIIFRFISKINYVDQITNFKIKYSKHNLNFNSCNDFLSSLNLEYLDTTKHRREMN